MNGPLVHQNAPGHCFIHEQSIVSYRVARLAAVMKASSASFVIMELPESTATHAYLKWKQSLTVDHWPMYCWQLFLHKWQALSSWAADNHAHAGKLYTYDLSRVEIGLCIQQQDFYQCYCFAGMFHVSLSIVRYSYVLMRCTSWLEVKFSSA